jgi:hypothetical protein
VLAATRVRVELVKPVSVRNFILLLDMQEMNRELYEVAEVPECIRLNRPVS